MKKQPKLVTKNWMVVRIAKNPIHVIGRALLAIFNNQTPDEQDHHATVLLNGIGFTAFDAELGTRCAKHYRDKKTLEPWMVKVWMEPDAKGYPKIAKYHRQLNDIAVSKLKPTLYKGVQSAIKAEYQGDLYR